MQSSAYLNEISQEIHHHRLQLNEILVDIDEAQFNWKEDTKKWSIAECLDHINVVAKLYLPAFKNAIDTAQEDKEDKVYKNGWLGKIAINKMEPKEKLKKMKAPPMFKPKSTEQSKYDISKVKEDFLLLQDAFDEIIKEAQKININKNKVSSPLSAMIKMRFGDMLKFIIIHQKRHLVQAARVKQSPNFS